MSSDSDPTRDPRDARIAEVEQAAIQWRLRMAELETEAQESDARIAVLEAELTLVEETATALGLKSMAASARRALEGRRLPDPRDARIAELEAALRGMVSAFESSGNEWGEKLEYEDSALSAARRALGDAHG